MVMSSYVRSVMRAGGRRQRMAQSSEVVVRSRHVSSPIRLPSQREGPPTTKVLLGPIGITTSQVMDAPTGRDQDRRVGVADHTHSSTLTTLNRNGKSGGTGRHVSLAGIVRRGRAAQSMLPEEWR